jgi:hypothetical protein
MSRFDFDNRKQARRANANRKNGITVRGSVVLLLGHEGLISMDITGPEGAERGSALIDKATARELGAALTAWGTNTVGCDQYGQPVPKDLVVLPYGFSPCPGKVVSGDPLPNHEVRIIMAASWYEVEGNPGLLLASYLAIGGLSELNPLDCGLTLEGAQINRVADPLKRYSLEDGFYHA